MRIIVNLKPYNFSQDFFTELCLKLLSRENDINTYWLTKYASFARMLHIFADSRQWFTSVLLIFSRF